MAKEEEKVDKKQERYELVEVPTQTAIAVRDNETEKVLQMEQVWAEIINKLDKIDKNTG